eukprot:1953552-Amphidinium_carterae.1
MYHVIICVGDGIVKEVVAIFLLQDVLDAWTPLHEGASVDAARTVQVIGRAAAVEGAECMVDSERAM